MNIFRNRGRGVWMAAMGVLLAGIVFALSSPAFAQSNLVYLESNIGSVPNMNSVFVFSNDGTGNLTQIAGSPFLTSGTGWYDPGLETSSIDTDHALIIDPTGNFLYAVNANSDTVSGFSIAAGGALTLITNPPLGTGGKEPESLSFSPAALRSGFNVIAIANKDNDPNQPGGIPSIQTVTTDSTGAMRPVHDSKIAFQAGDNLGSVNASSVAPHYVFAIQLLGDSKIISYRIGPLGKLEQVSSIGPPDNTENMLLGMAFHPTQHVMYVGVPNVPEIAIYTYTPDGILALSGTVANPGMAPCWFAMNTAGTRLYSVESEGGTVTVYDTTNATAPTQLQHITMSNQPQNATDAKIDPTGNFLYVVGGSNALENGSPFLHVFSINQTNGKLMPELTPVPLPVPPLEHPQGLAVLMK